MNEIIRPIILVGLIIFSTPAKNVKLNTLSLLGLAFSFGGLFFFKGFDSSFLSRQILFLYFSASTFYIGFILFGLISLGKNFGVVPALRNISTAGAFNYVRHPLYSSYIHLMTCSIVIFPNLRNAIAFLTVAIGLWLRCNAEESVLKADPKYLSYRKNVKAKFLHPVLSLPTLILLLAVSCFSFADPGAKNRPKVLKVIGASPITTLNPSEYDEWGAVFLGNNIYPRLLPDDKSSRAPAMGVITNRSCIHTVGAICQKERYKIAITPITGCAGQIIDANIVKHELGVIFSRKSWLFKTWQFCDSKKQNEICLEFTKADDIERRLKSVYIRHGWSLDLDKNKHLNQLGVSPYCLTDIKNSPLGLVHATLKPLQATLPTVQFAVANNESQDFDLSLYGNNEQVKKGKRKLITHTPSAFFVISNPKKSSKQNIAWNSQESFNAIQNHLEKGDLIIRGGEEFNSLFPKGNALARTGKTPQSPRVLLLPNFIPNCLELADTLNRLWKNQNYTSNTAVCEDISRFIPEKILGPKKNWDGFIVPLTPGGFFRNSITDQYFSKDSSESWIKDTKNPSDYYYRIGIAQSYVTSSDKICGIESNPLGLSDLLISDLKFCAK